MAKHPKLMLRNTSLQMSNSLNSSSPAPPPPPPSTAPAPPPLHPSSMLFSSDYLENSCPDDAIASRGSDQPPQLIRRYSVSPAARNGDTRSGAEDVRKRRFGTVRSGSLSKGIGGTIREDGRMGVSTDQKPDSDLDEKKETGSQWHRELLRRVLMWLLALLRLLLQRSSKVSIRDGASFMLGAISKFHPLKVIPPALIVIVMFLMSAAALLIVIWSRWRVSQAIPTS